MASPQTHRHASTLGAQASRLLRALLADPYQPRAISAPQRWERRRPACSERVSPTLTNPGPTARPCDDNVVCRRARRRTSRSNVACRRARRGTCDDIVACRRARRRTCDDKVAFRRARRRTYACNVAFRRGGGEVGTFASARCQPWQRGWASEIGGLPALAPGLGGFREPRASAGSDVWGLWKPPCQSPCPVCAPLARR